MERAGCLQAYDGQRRINMKIEGIKRRLMKFFGMFLIILALAALPGAATVFATDIAEEGEPGMVFGLGIILGEPTGISAKYWLSRTSALDFAAAWSFDGDDEFQFHSDYLMHFYDVIHVQEGKLPVYFGFGARIKHEKHRHDHDTVFGIRVPVGFSYELSRVPVELFGEFVPVLDIAPDTEGDINIGVGVRYYF